MEIDLGEFSGTGRFTVPSLPTRNGNPHSRHPFPTVLDGSQPTYKEWKLYSSSNSGPLVSAVPSLPTRNGNTLGSSGNTLVYGVPSLPTRNGNKVSPMPPRTPAARSQPTYKEWKSQQSQCCPQECHCVPSLPTRNGNINSLEVAGVKPGVPSLPTRNGNKKVLFPAI